MRTHPKANAKGARNRLARHASSKQNGRGKYQQTGLLVSFCLTSQRHVFERAQPPTLQQGGSPALMVLLGWTFAAMVYGVVLRLGQECGCWGSTIVGKFLRGVSALLVPAGPRLPDA